jgi:PAS domain S-box-containing protein
MLDRLNRQGEEHNLEVILLTKSGEERITIISSELIELGGVTHILASSNDITERKQAEDALRASEERFAKAFNASPQPMAILELPSRTYTNVNQALVRSSGWTTDEIIGRSSSEINVWANPEDAQRVSDLLSEHGYVRNMETQFRTKSGEIRDFLYSAEQIIFNGRPHILVVASDITERKLTEEALRQNEALLRSVIESNPDWIFVKDRQHRYKLVNQSYANSLHLEARHFIGRDDLELGFPDEQVKGNPEKGIRGFWADDLEVLATGKLKFIEEEPVEVDGHTHLFNTFKVPLLANDGSVWGVLGVGRDVTKLRHAETALRASEERFAKAFNASPQPMAIFEASGRRIVSVNEAMVRTFGWTTGEMVDHTPGDLDIWVDLEQQGHVRGLLASQGFVHNLEIKFRTKSGEVRDFLYSAETINLKDHRHVLVVASDITERKRVERALQESEERYRLLFEHGFAGVLRSTSSGQMIDCNDALARIFGCNSRDEFLQHDGRDFYFDPNERRQGVEELRAVDSLRNVERLMKRKDGSPVWTLSNYTVHQRRQNGTLVWDSVVLDITERKLIEQELAQSHEQLRSLSARLEQVREEERTRIAREIHDNLGQALTGLKLDFSWLDKNLARVKDEDLRRKTGPKLKEIAQLLEETIQTVRDIATELRPGVLDTLGLSAAIDWQSREFMRRSGIKCRVNVCREPQGIPPHQSTALFRVFQEILTNIARHAKAKHFSVKIADAGSNLTLTVQDDGIGITEEQLRNPTSLGLIGMRERVLGFGGSVRIVGKQQQGTTVTVSLPLGK